MTERLLTPAERAALDTGLVGFIDRLADALFPWLAPEARDCNPCLDHDHMTREAEELEL